MSHFAYNFMLLVTKVAKKSPENFVYAFTFLGMGIGIAAHAWLGGVLGSAVGHHTAGVWTGLGFYSYTFANNMEQLKANAEQRIATLKEMASRA